LFVRLQGDGATCVPVSTTQFLQSLRRPARQVTFRRNNAKGPATGLRAALSGADRPAMNFLSSMNRLRRKSLRRRFLFLRMSQWQAWIF
jgi:hypothetical protein